MTEQHWLACTDPTPMLEFLQGKASDRKLRLFSVACCRRIWDLFKDERIRNAVEVAELAIDGQATIAQRRASLKEVNDACAIAKDALGKTPGVEDFSASFAVFFTFGLDVISLGRTPEIVTMVEYVASHAAQAKNNDAERPNQAAFLRCIFGNPFRPVTVDPLWLIPTVTFLARIIYDERSFDQMPELADALEAAGCTNEDILAHCRMGNHIRGCWVLDLILGKE